MVVVDGDATVGTASWTQKQLRAGVFQLLHQTPEVVVLLLWL